jgi:phosphoribosylformylglycinamidine synthase subunit PurQ / glutaminase
LCSDRRNVVGLMPHPERACELQLGSADGLSVLESVVKYVTQGAVAAAR